MNMCICIFRYCGLKATAKDQRYDPTYVSGLVLRKKEYIYIHLYS